MAKGVVQVPEGRRIFARLTVTENLKMGAYVVTDKAAIAARIDDAFEMFPRLKERQSQVAGTLSGGEQQMLAMSRALMSAPKVLLLDEPSMGLAPILVDQIFDTISQLHARGTTILLVEQNARKALQIADRGYVIETGKIVLAEDAAEPARQRAGPEGLSRHRLTPSRSRPRSTAVAPDRHHRLGLTPERRRDDRQRPGHAQVLARRQVTDAHHGPAGDRVMDRHRRAPARPSAGLVHARAADGGQEAPIVEQGQRLIGGLGWPALQQLQGPGVEDPDAGAAVGFGAPADGEQQLAVR